MPGKTVAVGRDPAAGARRASMRPQRNAGENGRRSGSARACGRRASMRPQRNAGENAGRGCSRPASPAGFNEAPAKCRGKQAVYDHRLAVVEWLQ